MTVVLALSHLTAEQVDQKLRGSRAFTRSAMGWVRRVRQEGLLFDLSNCTEATLSGAAQLLILARHASESSINVSLKLPQVGVFERELAAFERRLDEGVNLEGHLVSMLVSRFTTYEFLANVGFMENLESLNRLGTATITIVADSAVPYDAVPTRLQKITAALVQDEEFIGVANSPFLIPSALRLQWISELSRESIRSLLAELVDVLSQGEMALPRPEAHSFANTVLFEALDNVRMHARRDSDPALEKRNPAALLGAAFARTSDRSLAAQGRAEAGSRYELKIVLGDTGAGIISRLGPFYKPRDHDRFLPAPVRRWSHAARTVAWAFHPLSTSRTDLTGEPPARGLSRARQQVRYHGGQIRVRTDTLNVVISHDKPLGEGKYQTAAAPYVAGTLLDISIPYRTRPSAILMARTPDQPSVQVLVLPVTTTLDDASRAGRLLAESLAASPEVTATVVFLPTGQVTANTGREYAALLGEMSAVTHGYPTTIVFARTSGADLFSHFEALAEHARALAVQAVSDDGDVGTPAPVSIPEEPMLLVGSDGHVTWWGGPEEARPALINLARNTGFEVAGGHGEDGEPPPSPSDGHHYALQRAGWITQAHGNTPAVSARTVDASLRSWLQERLSKHIATAGSGVERGDRLLPTLETVSRYVHLPAVLHGTGTVELAGYIGGTLTKNRLTEPLTLVAVLPDVPDGYVTAVCQSLGYTGRVVRLNPSLPGWRLRPAPVSGPGRSLLLAGVRHKGETLRAVAEQLVRWRLDPEVALVVLDALRPAGSPVVALHATIPVAALVDIDLPSATSPKELLAKQRSEAEVPPFPYPILPRAFADVLASHGVGFTLVHIERSSERHLVGYYDFREALDQQEIRDLVDEQVARTVSRLVRGLQGTAHHFFYPSDDNRVAGPLANRVSEQFPGSQVHPLSRSPSLAAGRENAASTPKIGGLAVFLDWGVVTAHTARQELFELVKRGAAPAIFVAVASQLDPTTERHLRSIAALHGGDRRRAEASRVRQQASFDDVGAESAENGPSGNREDESPIAFPAATGTDFVPVAFRCLTRIPSITSTAESCPLCHVLGELGIYARAAISPLLQSHASEKLAMLQPKSREEALRYPRDLYGADMTKAERTALISLWHDIHDAAQSEAGSLRLLDRLETSTGDTREHLAVAVCRILSARNDLLHSPPLIYRSFRLVLIDLSLGLLDRDVQTQSVLSSPVRRQAVVTLRASSKDAFIDALPRIIRVNLHSRAVVSEILLATYSILERPYFHGTTLMTHLHSQLQECESALTGAELAGSVDEDVVHTVRVLKRRASTRIGRAESGSSLIAAWSALRLEYGPDVRLHHHAINKLRQIGQRLDDLVTQNAVVGRDLAARGGVLRRLNSLWQDCADFLAASVLPHLPHVREILSSNYYRDKVADPEDWAQWVDLLESDCTEQDLLFPRHLLRLLDHPEEFDEYARGELARYAKWLQRLFMPVRRAEQMATRPRQTLLLQWLEECPTMVSLFRDTLGYALQDRGERFRFTVRGPSGRELDALLLFAPTGLLEEVASTIAANVEEHAMAEEVDVSLVIRRGDGAVEFIVRSHGTAQAGMVRSREGGLAGLRRRLAPFQCGVDWSAEQGDFLTVVSPRLWEGVYE